MSGDAWGGAWASAWGVAWGHVAKAVTGGGSGVGGGTSSWEHRAGWLEYTYEKQRRYDELYKKLLAAERALEQVQFETVTKTTVAQIAQERQYIKELKLKIAVLKQQLEELVAAAEEEHLMVALLAW